MTTESNSLSRARGRLQELLREKAVKTKERVGTYVEAIAGFVIYRPRRRRSHSCVSAHGKHSMILNRVGKVEGSTSKQQV
ncbi:hypothetical protein BHM03_00022063 [Ensete ventricosum]|nr:hypothetical protein BHM03_00022063 [Ensete ventricosum]